MPDLSRQETREARVAAIARSGIEWYVAGLRDQLKGIPVRNFDEATAAYAAALETFDRLAARVDTLTARHETALATLKDAAGWDSSRPYTQEEARGYHTAMVMAMALLKGDIDEVALSYSERMREAAEAAALASDVPADEETT